MSNNYWDEDEDDQDTDNEGHMDGSDLLKKLRKAKRNDEKRIKELTEQLEGLSKAQRERTVKEVLEQKGVNPKAQRLMSNAFKKGKLRGACFKLMFFFEMYKEAKLEILLYDN